MTTKTNVKAGGWMQRAIDSRPADLRRKGPEGVDLRARLPDDYRRVMLPCMGSSPGLDFFVRRLIANQNLT